MTKTIVWEKAGQEAVTGPNSSGSEVVVRALQPADLPQVLELMRTALGEGTAPRTAAFWRWKHERNPFGRSPARLVEAEGRIVSLRVFLRWRWLYRGHKLAAVRPVDTATHPDWRRRGLFERLTRELVEAMREEGVSFLFNTPNARSGQGYQKLGWRLVGRPTIWIRAARPLSLLRVLMKRNEGSEHAARRPEGVSSELLESPDLPCFIAGLASAPPRLVTDADASYLRWRYRECPGVAYGAAGAFDGASGALLVFRHVARHGARELRLCDLFVADDRSSRRRAREEMRHLVRHHDADLVSARAVPGTAPAEVLALAGFLPLPRTGPILAVRPLTAAADGAKLDRLSTWRPSIGDLEIF